MVLETVEFKPDRSVLFVPETNRQTIDLSIENPTTTPVAFKMKSNRNALYKMRPVFGVIAVGEKTIVKVSCKGLKEGQKPPISDWITIVLAQAPGYSGNGKALWKKPMKKELEMIKHKLAVLYKGVNDDMPVSDVFPFNSQNSETENNPVKEEKKEEAVDGKKTRVKSPLVQKELSVTGSEDEEEKAKTPEKQSKKSDNGRQKTKKSSSSGAKTPSSGMKKK